uniref:Uncharacterized protein n=1 Tax=Physcomitrium patens TaxID=3218 RepID=A0A2K1INB4_PHYPA|nr:hypothetical protein PHYPA_027076 [Physcomitrium patens]PNR30762.1 hypothetical protein PHYPA_027078 [Physcomitrium patens]
MTGIDRLLVHCSNLRCSRYVEFGISDFYLYDICIISFHHAPLGYIWVKPIFTPISTRWPEMTSETLG